MCQMLGHRSVHPEKEGALMRSGEFRAVVLNGSLVSSAPASAASGPFALPPPPEKMPLAGPTFYEYPGEFEDDVANVEPSLGPSSPPFEEEPSAPPLEFAASAVAHMVGPSAPPLEYAEGPCCTGL